MNTKSSFKTNKGQTEGGGAPAPNKTKESKTMENNIFDKNTVIRAIVNNKSLKGNGGLPEAIRIYNTMTDEERNEEAKMYINCGGRY